MGLQKKSINHQDLPNDTSEPANEAIKSLQQVIQNIAKFKGSKCFLIEFYSKRIICPEDSPVTFCREELREIREKGWSFYTQYVPNYEIQHIAAAVHAAENLLNENLLFLTIPTHSTFTFAGTIKQSLSPTIYTRCS